MRGPQPRLSPAAACAAAARPHGPAAAPALLRALATGQGQAEAEGEGHRGQDVWPEEQGRAAGALSCCSSVQRPPVPLLSSSRCRPRLAPCYRRVPTLPAAVHRAAPPTQARAPRCRSMCSSCRRARSRRRTRAWRSPAARCAGRGRGRLERDAACADSRLRALCGNIQKAPRRWRRRLDEQQRCQGSGGRAASVLRVATHRRAAPRCRRRACRTRRRRRRRARRSWPTCLR